MPSPPSARLPSLTACPPPLPAAVIHNVDTVLAPSAEALAAEVVDEAEEDTEDDVIEEESEVILLEFVQSYNLTNLVGTIFVSPAGCSCVSVCCWMHACCHLAQRLLAGQGARMQGAGGRAAPSHT